MSELEAQQAKLKELFSRPNFPDDPPFFWQAHRLLLEARSQGEQPRTLIVTPEQEKEADIFMDKVTEFQDAWGMKRAPTFPGVPMIRTLYGLKMKVGDSLAVTDEP